MMRTMWTPLIRAGALAGVTLAAALSAVSPLSGQIKMPKYEIDLTWPKPLPERWVLGGIGGVCVDNHDHVLLLHRQEITEGDLNAGYLAPPIIEFDETGKVVNSWAKPDVMDPRLHSCYFDKNDNLWIAAAPSGMVQQFSHDGSKLLSQIGKKGVFDSEDGTPRGKPLNSNAARFLMPSSIYVDPGNGDVYISDGESRNSNRRIAVMDKSGAFLRQWQPEGMQSVHCLSVANDGLVYVCNREGSRLQVYDKSGKFLNNIDVPWKPYTVPPDGKIVEVGGSAVSLDLSKDPAQSLMFLINQNSAQIEVIDRKAGKIIGHFGGGVGHYPGQFDQPHGIAVDSKGNVYVAENRGKRIQKFKVVN